MPIGSAGAGVVVIAALMMRLWGPQRGDAVRSACFFSNSSQKGRFVIFSTFDHLSFPTTHLFIALPTPKNWDPDIDKKWQVHQLRASPALPAVGIAWLSGL
jgi:hypothetical protein